MNPWTDEDDDREIADHEGRVAAVQECLFLIAVIVGGGLLLWLGWTIR